MPGGHAMHSFRSFLALTFRREFSSSDRPALIFSTAIVLLSFSAWSPPTDASERVGTIPGEFAVSPTGEATYDMPIQAPASTGGLRPDISLRYRHRGGSGIAGQGWTVGGLSGISRCPQTLAQDGQIRQVQYDANDRFCLDGQRLVVVSGTYGANGAYYRTEIESFRRVRSYGSQGNGPQYFVVEERNGTRHWYGHSWGSSLQDPTSGSYVNWVRRLTRDRFDNEIQYHYTADNTAGEQTLDRIDYTANNGQALSARYRLRFVYQTRPASDQRSGYRYGLLWSRSERLYQVHVEHSPYGTGTFDTVYQ